MNSKVPQNDKCWIAKSDETRGGKYNQEKKVLEWFRYRLFSHLCSVLKNTAVIQHFVHISSVVLDHFSLSIVSAYDELALAWCFTSFAAVTMMSACV